MQDGSKADVKYTVSLGDLKVAIDWNESTPVGGSAAFAAALAPGSKGAAGLRSIVRGIAKAVGVWYRQPVPMLPVCHSIGYPLWIQYRTGERVGVVRSFYHPVTFSFIVGSPLFVTPLPMKTAGVHQVQHHRYHKVLQA